MQTLIKQLHAPSRAGRHYTAKLECYDEVCVYELPSYTYQLNGLNAYVSNEFALARYRTSGEVLHVAMRKAATYSSSSMKIPLYNSITIALRHARTL
jgi:hypothetical protein